MIASLPGADMLWLDAISNPLLDVPELDVLAQAAHDEGALVVVDATLVTPVLQRPLSLGADLVVHSATKAIGGHSDLLLGVAIARTHETAERLSDARTMFGAVPGTFEAWLALRGLRTLPLRVERAQATASRLASDLSGRDEVSWVGYPGLASDPANDAAKRLLDGPGTMVAFEIEGGVERAEAICEAVQVITHAASLGGVETLIERHGRWCSASHVPSALLRLSVGCEDPDDLWHDLDRALVLPPRASEAAAELHRVKHGGDREHRPREQEPAPQERTCAEAGRFDDFCFREAQDDREPDDEQESGQDRGDAHVVER